MGTPKGPVKAFTVSRIGGRTAKKTMMKARPKSSEPAIQPSQIHPHGE